MRNIAEIVGKPFVNLDELRFGAEPTTVPHIIHRSVTQQTSKEVTEMVSTIAAALFLTAISLAVWTIAHTLRTHASQIAALYGKQATVPGLSTKARRNNDVRRPVKISPLRPASQRAAA